MPAEPGGEPGWEEAALRALAREGRELGTGERVEAWRAAAPPTALEFHRECVARSRPCVFRRAALGPEARACAALAGGWTSAALIERCRGLSVTVALTPDGRADSVAASPADGREYFAEPAEEKMDLAAFFELLGDPSADGVPYLQLQDDSLRKEFAPLLADVPENGPAFAAAAFGRPPEAVNLWIGDGRSLTSW